MIIKVPIQIISWFLDNVDILKKVPSLKKMILLIASGFEITEKKGPSRPIPKVSRNDENRTITRSLGSCAFDSPKMNQIFLNTLFILSFYRVLGEGSTI